MNTKFKLVSAILIILVSINAIAFAATSTSASGETSGGPLGKATTSAVCDGGDHFWPTVDDVHCTTNANKTIKVTVAATIYWSGGSATGSNNNNNGSVYLQVNGSNCSCTSASSQHTVESQDYGNWSKSLSCEYTIF